MEPKFEKKGALKLVGLRYVGPMDPQAFPALWEKFMGKLMGAGFCMTGEWSAFGLCRCEGSCDEGRVDYMAAIEASMLKEPIEGFETTDIPANEYAVFESPSLQKIGEVYEEIYRKWLPQSGFVPGNYSFEFYPSDFLPEGPITRLYLYVPVTKPGPAKKGGCGCCCDGK